MRKRVTTGNVRDGMVSLNGIKFYQFCAFRCKYKNYAGNNLWEFSLTMMTSFLTRTWYHTFFRRSATALCQNKEGNQQGD
jgi:hypothetical protein